MINIVKVCELNMNSILKSVTKSVEEITGHKIVNTNDELIRSGIIDSFGILQLIITLETELGIKLEDYDLDAKNFSTVNSIAEMINHKDQATRDHNDYSSE